MPIITKRSAPKGPLNKPTASKPSTLKKEVKAPELPPILDTPLKQKLHAARLEEKRFAARNDPRAARYILVVARLERELEALS